MEFYRLVDALCVGGKRSRPATFVEVNACCLDWCPKQHYAKDNPSHHRARVVFAIEKCQTNAKQHYSRDRKPACRERGLGCLSTPLDAVIDVALRCGAHGRIQGAFVPRSVWLPCLA